MIRIPYEWLENLFGPVIAENFNKIMLGFTFLGLVTYGIMQINRRK